LNTNYKLACAISAVLGGYAGAGYAADTSAASTASSESAGLAEIVVTAQRRSESIQDVPITIQALSGAQLKDLSVSTIEDVLKYLPNVTFGTNGPGSGNIFMRGLSAGFAGNQSSATIAPFPNVATYIDDQSVTFPARNLDVYYADMERIEVLEGPQGTLFGGGAEAGVIRYITNKPKINVTEGDVQASYGTTAAGGDPNSSGIAVLNVPVIADTLAVRGVIYADHRGGYIDNVPSTFTRMNTDPGNHYFANLAVNGKCPNGLPPNPTSGGCVPANSQSANNYNLAGTATNPVDYTGIRVSALWDINSDWNVLIQQSYQNMEADGEFTQFPIGSEGQALGPWQDTSFSPAVDEDKFENTAWTFNGRIGDLKAVYTGAYLVRNLYQTNDYTNYARSNGGYYYSCTGGGANGTGFDNKVPTPVVCYSPVTSWQDTVRNTHQSHEIRLSTPDDWRARGILGAYWEDFEIQDDMNFLYKTFPSCTPSNLATALGGGAPCVANVITAPGTQAMNPGERNDNTAFGEDAQRGYHQTAVFLSADYDLIPKVLTATAGTRWYRYTDFEDGSEYVTATSLTDVPNGSVFNGHNITAENLHSTYTGFRSRGNLTWHITPDVMVYYTFSQGFRPGGFNRSQGLEAPISNGGVDQYQKPQGYAPDELINNEVGWKTEFLDHRLQINGSMYYMKWNNVQMEFYNPPVLGNTTFAVNGPNFTVKGFELQAAARITDGLTLMGSSSYNDARQTNSPCLTVSNPALIGTPSYGTCITESYQKGIGVEPLVNPFGAEGTRPAFSPILQFNLRARYDLTINEYKTWVMAGASHVGDMSNNPATYTAGSTQPIPQTTFLRYDQPGYTTYDASIGVGKDNWTVQAFGQNLSNSDASVFTSSAQFIKAEVPLRPRVLGVTVGFKF
jgi:iron complex outermembrane recepter protein